MVEAWRYLIVISLLSSALYYRATTMYHDCLPVKKMQMRLFKEGWAFVGTGLDTRFASAVQIFVNNKDHTFLILGVDKNLEGCVLLKGIDWTPVFG